MPTKTSTTGLQATVSREKLQEGLAMVAAAVPGKTTLPVLANVRIDATDRGLRFTASDLDLTIETEIVADVERSGSITAPAKKLLAIVKELSPAPVRLGTCDTLSASQILIDCGRAHYKLLGVPTDEFPSLVPIDFHGESLRAGELSEVIRRVSFAASTEQSRPILNGVLWQRKRTTTRLVATNGHRLAYVERTIDPELGAEGEYIVPPKALQQVAKLFPHDDRIAIGMSETGSHLAFRSDTTCVTTRIIEGPYPNYREVIPTTATYRALTDCAALMSALRRCLPIASTEAHRLVVTFDAGMIRLAVHTPDVGECTDEVPARIQAEGDDAPFTFGVNGQYLLELLSAVGTEQVMLQGTAPERAIVLRPQDEELNQSSLFLIMPLRLLD